MAEFMVQCFDFRMGEESLRSSGRCWGEVAYQCNNWELMMIILCVVFVASVLISDPTTSNGKVSCMDKLSIPWMQVKIHCTKGSIFFVVEVKLSISSSEEDSVLAEREDASVRRTVSHSRMAVLASWMKSDGCERLGRLNRVGC